MHPAYYPSLVLYEDNHLLVVNKPSGSLVQGDRTGDKPLVDIYKDYIKEKYHKPGAVFLGVVHRLDRPVSGVLAFAKTSKALERMNKLFRTREVRKTYWAIVTHKPPEAEGKLVHWLKKDNVKNVTTAYAKEVGNSKKAELNYRLIGIQEQQYLLEVEPLTGRPHQIRVQLAKMGCVIKGDVKYGADQPNKEADICLFARRLSFTHPVGQEPVVIEAPVPAYESWKLFANFTA